MVMVAKRVLALTCIVAVCIMGTMGCSHNSDSNAIDAPLMKNAPPPPPRPNKPILSPSGDGGGKTGGSTAGGTSAGSGSP